MADACGTIVGACIGTSTVTSYVESSAGVANGGRTGLTAVTAAVLFIVALFFSPIFLAIPSFATAPALVWVGLLMIGAVRNMHFDGDIADVVGGFLALIMMPFTYSIANGIMFGILAWVILKVLTGKVKEYSCSHVDCCHFVRAACCHTYHAADSLIKIKRGRRPLF